jgi:hypothetical protein
MKLSKNPAQRRYLIRIAIATGCYIVTLAIAVRLIRDGGIYGLPAFAIGVLPGLSVAAMFWSVGRLIVEEKDEYLRMLLVRQSLIASGFALTLTTIWGFLENFGLVAHIDGFYVAILWFIGLGIGALVNRLHGRISVTSTDDAS